MNCTTCGSEIEPERIQKEAGSLARAGNKTAPNPKKLRACKYCGLVEGCKAMRLHIPRCESNPNRKPKKLPEI